MTDMNWIKSAGGPLVCLELVIANSWLGVTGNSVSKEQGSRAATDYERACQVKDYLGKIPLGDHAALILGDMPLETLIWRRRDAIPMIVRVIYGDPGVDVTKILEQGIGLYFDDPIETLEVKVKSGPMIIFDSAFPGGDASNKSLSLDLPLGRYTALTKQFFPDDRTSVLVHKFELLN
jgi:hypothetical protein